MKRKAKEAEENAKKEKEKEKAEKEKKEREEARRAEEDAKKQKDLDDSENVRKKAEEEREKAKREKEKEDIDNMNGKKEKNRLNDLLGLLGLIGTTLAISSIFTPVGDPQIDSRPFCVKNPWHPSCIPICLGPMCYPSCMGPNCPTYNPNTVYRPPPPSPARRQLEGPEVSYLEFTLDSRPAKDLTILLESTSDDLELDENQITFNLDKWNIPIIIPFYIEKVDITTDRGYQNMTSTDKLQQLTRKIEKPIVKQESLDAYYPTEQEIQEKADHLKYLLDTSDDDIEKTIRDIEDNIENKRKMHLLKGGDIEPTYDDKDYVYLENEYDIEPMYEDEDYKPYEESVEPMYDDEDYRYLENEFDIEPPYDIMIGGEYNNNLRNPEDIINDVDPNNFSTDVNVSDLSDEHKSYFSMTLLENATTSFDIQVRSLSSFYQTDPTIVTFDKTTSVNDVSIYQTQLLNTLQNVRTSNITESKTEEFNRSIDNRYNTEYQDIMNEKAMGEREADLVYERTYNNSLNNTNQRIYEAERLRNQMYYGGNRFSTRKKNHTKKNQTNKIIK